MYFAEVTQPQVTRQNTVGDVNHDRKTHLFLCSESKPWTAAMPLAWVWARALQLQHFGVEFLVGQIGRIKVNEILEVNRDQT